MGLDHMRIPTKTEAEEILVWAQEQNPGLWADHCRVVAKASETIALYANLDINRAYVSGLLHDIGRFEGVRDMHHLYAGYKLMTDKGYHAIAEVCISHSFPYQDIAAYGGGTYDCNEEELLAITSFLESKQYNDYDRLIQLCDALGTAQGICMIETRILDVLRRHGVDAYSSKRIDSFYSLKNYFDELCGRNIYTLFQNEIISSILK